MRSWQIIAALAACFGGAILADTANAIAPDNPGAAAIQFTLNSGENVKTISPWIYGSNSTNIANRTFDRSGGNRMTGYNWENNASNAGADWYHHSDYGMANNNPNAPPGSAVRGMIHRRRHQRAAPRSSRCPWPAMSPPTATAPSTKRKSPLRRAGSKS